MRRVQARMATGLAVAAMMVVGTAVAAAGASVEGAEAVDCVAEVEPNDVRDEAATFEGEWCISGSVLEVGDVDVFVWQVSEADAETTWSLELESVSETEAEVTLSRVDDEAEVELERMAADAVSETATTEVSVEEGTYELVVRHPTAADETAPSAGGDYELRLLRAASPELEPEPTAVADETVAADETARIAVVAGEDGAPTIGPAVAFELVLDTSGSMLERLGQRTKLEVAQRTLIDVVDELPSDTPVALRTFKAQPRSCATVLRVPLEPLRPKAMKQTIRDLPVRKGTRTPIAKAVGQAGRDLSAAEGHRLIVLVTDGKEDCEGDPAAAIGALVDAEATTTVHLIGFALPADEDLRRELAEWATIGGGRFLEATDRATLAAALEAATTAPYLVFDEEDVLVAQGLVGDEGVEVKAGVYRVDVLSDPPASFEAVELEAGAEVDLSLET